MVKKFSVVFFLCFIVLTGCSNTKSEKKTEDKETQKDITAGKKKSRGFIVDNTFHGDKDIHYSSYIPEDYDDSKKYALFFTLPGWEGLYFQGVGKNLEWEDFGTEARKYNKNMIVISPQLDDWGEQSANDTIALIEYLIENYNIDTSKVYLHGMSGGGETGSLVMEKKPKLFAGYFMTSSKWVGDLNVLAKAKTPVYMAIGENDSYYGSKSLKDVYNTLENLYKKQGLSRKEIKNILVLDVKDNTFFKKKGYDDQHMGGQAFAHEKKMMKWLFDKTRISK